VRVGRVAEAEARRACGHQSLEIWRDELVRRLAQATPHLAIVRLSVGARLAVDVVVGPGLARERALSLIGQGKEVKFFCVGRKGFEQLRRTFEKQIVENLDLRAVRQLGFVNAEDIAKKVIARFDNGEFDVCTLFYSRFKSVISQVPTAQQIIPLVVEAPAANAGPATSYEYEPEEDEILSSLLPRNLAVQIFRALLENNASFYGAQMSAMDNATRNAGDMIRKQTLIYNRTRQAMITKELIEIISGAEAL
jgi:F-type H+-transporting ATPase subunit gamma